MDPSGYFRMTRPCVIIGLDPTIHLLFIPPFVKGVPERRGIFRDGLPAIALATAGGFRIKSLPAKAVLPLAKGE